MIEADARRRAFKQCGFLNYKQYVELGRLYAGANNFAGAENAYRRALELETRLFGPDSVAVGEAIAELALQVSNQARFAEAAELFHRAAPIIEGSSSATARSRLASYRALDAANQRQFADALKYAREATAVRREEIAAATHANPDSDTADIGVSRGELAHSLRIEAEMALRLGDLAAARAAAEEALWIISEEPGLPLWWRPEAVSLMGEINEREGRVVVAERDFKDALALDQKLFGDTAPTALIELRTGRFYSDQQVYQPAVASFRAAFAILAKDRSRARRSCPIRSFHSLQLRMHCSRSTAARSTAGRCFPRQPTHQLGHRRSDHRPRRRAPSSWKFRTRRGRSPSSGDRAPARQHPHRLGGRIRKADQDRHAARESKLSDDLKAASARYESLSAKVEQEFPDYAKLADPGPVELPICRRTCTGRSVSFLRHRRKGQLCAACHFSGLDDQTVRDWLIGTCRRY